LVKVRQLTKTFGTNRVLKGVDLDVPKSSVLSIIGASGSGKTTLLRCVNLLETYDSGSIKVDGIEIGYREGGRRRSERELARIRAEKAWCFSSSTCSGT
jgi:polar amino acid transport system ATP-binding protein